MLCPNCHKEIDDDSIFCIFCGYKIKEDLPLINKNTDTETVRKKEGYNTKENKKIAKNPEVENALNSSKSSIKGLLISFNIIFILAIIIISMILAHNYSVIEEYKEGNEKLSKTIVTYSNDLARLRDENNTLKSDYNNLKSDYNNLIKQKNDQDINADEGNNFQSNRYDNTEIAFLNNVSSRILDEYNLAVNHMNTYHGDNWIFNNPSDIALEDTFLVRLQEILNNLKNISCPNSLLEEKNNLISIMEELCHYKSLQIDCMRSNNYDCNISNLNAFISNANNLFNYYNSLVE